MSKIDTLYESAQKATPKPTPDAAVHLDYGYEEIGWRSDAPGSGGYVEWTDEDFTYIALADPQTVMALVEVYRAAVPVDRDNGHSQFSAMYARLCVAIKKVEALDRGGGQGRG